jgi:dTDP-4-amino-4,6-dideoxygalactose transaminase
MIYYPVPAHKQKMFSAFNVGEQELPATNWLTTRVLSLPIHTDMDEEQLQYIVSTVLKYIN